MAESTTPTTPSTTPTTAPKEAASKQYIRVSSKDDELEPDALRGSDQVKKDAKVQDDEEERRKLYQEEKK